MVIKVKWKVGEPPTGRYRSFHNRTWPSAEYSNGDPALSIACDDSYTSARAKSGQHAPLTLSIAQWPETRIDGQSSFTWRRLKQRFSTLAEAKAAGEQFINGHPDYVPRSLLTS